MNKILRILAAVLLSTTTVQAQFDEYSYGLIGQYQAAETDAKVERIDPDMAFLWNTAPSPALPDAKFSVTWTGQLLIKVPTEYQFYADTNGPVTIKINDQVVLETTQPGPDVVRGPSVNIPAGFQEITIEYEAQSDAPKLKLFWSSTEFQIEPLPAHHLFHETNSDLNLIESGRQQFEDFRCHRCHGGLDPDLLPAPAFWGITKGLNQVWLIEKLMGGHAEAASDRMPRFGLSQDDAKAIAAYLNQLPDRFDFVSPRKPNTKKGDPNGEELLYSLGCISCHRIGETGNAGPYSGGDLSQIASKRSPEWLTTWLSQPNRMNPPHRMPVFKLTSTERSLLVSELGKLGKYNPDEFKKTKAPSAVSDRGRELVKQLRCANCHKAPAIEADLRGYTQLAGHSIDWKRSCLEKNDGQRPYFPNANADAIKAYVNSHFKNQRTHESTFDKGRHLLERNNCLACHRRGTLSGNSELAGHIAKTIQPLKGKSQVLVPPSLNAVGDKLRDDVLTEAISGKQERARADWLKIRMPRFTHTAEEAQALEEYFIQHDRIPASLIGEIPKTKKSGDALYLTGRQLIGAGALSCIACHQVGEYVPKNVALGTRGSNLLNIQQRLRPEFYFRWTRSPLRVVPGMEMPSYQKPVPGLPEESIEEQLAAIWGALGNPDFEAPTNPTQVEQLLFVNKGGAPRVVRDVFTVAEGNQGKVVARSMAIGFPTQHSLLFDIDSATIRGWTFGHFARQRTEGKSWYWDLAGTNVAVGFEASPDLMLMKTNAQGDRRYHELSRTYPDRLAQLLEYKVDISGVMVKYQLNVGIEGTAHEVVITERIESWEEGTESGFRRVLKSDALPDRYQIVYRVPRLKQPRFKGKVSTGAGSELTFVEEIAALIVPPEEPQVLIYKAKTSASIIKSIETKPVFPPLTPVTTLPGYVGTRIPVPSSIMPTGLDWDKEGRLVLTSLKGSVYRAVDTDKNGVEDRLELIEEGLSAPFGILSDGDDLLVSHKAELIRLHGATTGKVYHRSVEADGWGFTDNYHDWVTGPVRDRKGNLYVALGSDYSQPDRDRDHAKWRGKVLQVDQRGNVHPIAHELRYPIGLAFDAEDQLFTSDQQGVQNTFNEINHIQLGHRYGVPGQLDGEGDLPSATPAAVQIPHPFTRSVNGIFFLPATLDSPFAGHGIGCEYNGKFLIRFTSHKVNGKLQGAVYPFTNNQFKDTSETFLGPICGSVSPDGKIYIGSIHDSGWLGGLNTGEIVQLKPQGKLPNGILEVRGSKTGFTIEFIHPLPADQQFGQENLSITGYTRVWKGTYGTENSGTYTPQINRVQISANRKVATVDVSGLKREFVYELNLQNLGQIFPSFAAYSMNDF